MQQPIQQTSKLAINILEQFLWRTVMFVFSWIASWLASERKI